MKKNTVLEKSYDFSLMVISLYKKLELDREFVISRQVLRSGTSIGANIEEAQDGYSRAEFKHKLSIALKEARETQYWLRLLKHSKLADVSVDQELEAVAEILRLLTSIVKSIDS